MKQPDHNVLEPKVLIADASEEKRHLLMQYVAIEWPNASILEKEGSIRDLASTDPSLADCDLVLVGVGPDDTVDTGWVDRIQALDDAPSVVAVVEGGANAAQQYAAWLGPAAVLTGPEGGFDAAERTGIRALPQAHAVTLGPRVLRAETAAMAATALWMGVSGDWQNGCEKR